MRYRKGSPELNRWVFGYGSLIWRPDIDFIERRPARVHGWARRFWQGSHDHRGVPERPGRVVTLVEAREDFCDGMAYLVEQTVVEDTFAALDHREKNGYERHEIDLHFHDDDAARASVAGLVYIAPRDNFAFLGPAPVSEMVAQIHTSAGPSGRNVDYLLELAQALRANAFEDDHVFELEAALRALPAPPPQRLR